MVDDALRAAYEETLLAAAREGAADFICGSPVCRDCPFVEKQCSCIDSTVEGSAGVERTVEEWQRWWYEVSGERDTRTCEQILGEQILGEQILGEQILGEQTAESDGIDSTDRTDCTDCTEIRPATGVADTVDSAHTVDSADTLQPTVDITWTTADGRVEHRTGPMSLLSTEMRRFSKELSVWMECMSRPAEQIGNSVAEQIAFTATDTTGAVIAKCELFAELFGKCKCWADIVH